MLSQRILLAGLWLLFCVNSTSWAEVTYTTVAYEGLSAPGVPNGVFTFLRTSPAINDAGAVLFGGLVADGVTGTSALWSGPASAPQLVIRGNEPVPGLPDFKFSEVSAGNAVIDQNGHIAFFSSLKGKDDPGPYPNSYAVFGGPANSIDLIGVGHGLEAANADQYVILDSHDSALYSGPAGALQPLAMDGQQAPGFPAGTVHKYTSLAAERTINSSGQISFDTRVATGTSIGYAIWTGRAGNLHLVAATDQIAPGTGGRIFDSVGFSRINSVGSIIFLGSLKRAFSSDPLDLGIWYGDPASPQLLVRTNDPAPGTNARLAGPYFHPYYSGSGHVAYTSALVGDDVVPGFNDHGLWAGTVDAQKLVVRMGDPAPGTMEGVVFKSLLSYVQNSTGQIAFTATLAGPGITPSMNDSGMWMTGLDGALEMVLRAGDPFPIGDGTFKTIDPIYKYLNSGGGEDGLSCPFNASGQLAFSAVFGDSTSGIFIAQVPEPMVPAIVLGILALRRTARFGSLRSRRDESRERTAAESDKS